MLIWLDSAANRKAHPNENYAREVMELYPRPGPLHREGHPGGGPAPTGWFVVRDRFSMLPTQRRRREGDLRQDGAVPEARTSPAPARPARPARVPRGEALSPLRQRSGCALAGPARPALQGPPVVRLRHRRDGPDVPPVEPLLRRGGPASWVKSPVEMAVGTVRALEILKPTVSASGCADSMAGWVRRSTPRRASPAGTAHNLDQHDGDAQPDQPRLGPARQGRREARRPMRRAKALAAEHGVEPRKFYTGVYSSRTPSKPASSAPSRERPRSRRSS